MLVLLRLVKARYLQIERSNTGWQNQLYRVGLPKCRRFLLSSFKKFHLLLQLLPCPTGYWNFYKKSKQNTATLRQLRPVYEDGKSKFWWNTLVREFEPHTGPFTVSQYLPRLPYIRFILSPSSLLYYIASYFVNVWFYMQRKLANLITSAQMFFTLGCFLCSSSGYRKCTFCAALPSAASLRVCELFAPLRFANIYDLLRGAGARSFLRPPGVPYVSPC